MKRVRRPDAAIEDGDVAALLLSGPGPEELRDPGGLLRPLDEALFRCLAQCAPDHPVRAAGLALLYAEGLRRDDRRALLRSCFDRVSPDLFRRALAAVLDETRRWRNRPLDRCYPLLFLDGVSMRIGNGDPSRSAWVRVAQAVSEVGVRAVLGLWAGPPGLTPVLVGLRRRGVEEIGAAVIDRGRPGFCVLPRPMAAPADAPAPQL